MEICKADIHDIIDIKQDEEFIFREGIHLKPWEYKYSFIAKEQEEILGYIYAEEIQYVKTIIILGLEVKEKYRRNGIATQLIEKLEQECKDNGINQEMIVYKESSILEKFYGSKGFEMKSKLQSVVKELWLKQFAKLVKV